MRLVKQVLERPIQLRGEIAADVFVERLRSSLRPDACLRVDVDSVANDIDAPGFCFPFRQIPCCAPPHGSMWFEFQCNGEPIGVLLQSEADAQGFSCVGTVIQGYQGKASIIVAAFCFKVDGNGRLSEDVKASDENVEFCVAVVLHSISRMHCRNVKVGVAGNTKAPGWKRSETPGKMMHEIVVTDVPRTLKTGRAIFRDQRALRLHWVRGHYADYRKHGLFGRVKALFWIPEHKRGDESLGVSGHTFKVI